MLQRPDSVAADALRDMAAILDADKVSKVEMVVAPRVASELLSTKRQLLGRTERIYGKHVDVRVSETVPVDRVSFYGYDALGTDLDVANLPLPRKSKDLVQWEVVAGEDFTGSPEEDAASMALEPEPELVEDEVHPIEIDDVDGPEQQPPPLQQDQQNLQDQQGTESDGRGGRRRRRGGRGRADGPAGGRGDNRVDGRQGRPPCSRLQDRRRFSSGAIDSSVPHRQYCSRSRRSSS